MFIGQESIQIFQQLILLIERFFQKFFKDIQKKIKNFRKLQVQIAEIFITKNIGIIPLVIGQLIIIGIRREGKEGILAPLPLILIQYMLK